MSGDEDFENDIYATIGRRSILRVDRNFTCEANANDEEELSNHFDNESGGGDQDDYEWQQSDTFPIFKFVEEFSDEGLHRSHSLDEDDDCQSLNSEFCDTFNESADINNFENVSKSIFDSQNDEDGFFDVQSDENTLINEESNATVVNGTVKVLSQSGDCGVVSEVKDRINNVPLSVVPDNDMHPFNPSNIDGIKTGDWIRKWNDILTIGGVPQSVQIELMLHLHDGIGASCNLPIVEVTSLSSEDVDEKTPVNNIEVTVEDVDMEDEDIEFNERQQEATAMPPPVDVKKLKTRRRRRITTSCYVPPDRNDFTIDVCKNGCMAFHGKRFINGVEEDMSTKLFCQNPRCMTQRYSSSCKFCLDKPYGFCSPFLQRKVVSKNGTVRMKPPHSAVNRVPQETMFFRSILAKIIELYLISTSVPGQEHLLDYESQRVKRDGCLIDILDGKVMQEHLRGMHDVCADKQQDYRDSDGNKTVLHELSLCLTLFYDGKMNFKRKADSMWPMLCSIMNCNPSHRSQLGIGLFLTALHNMSVGSGAETYLIEELLVKELRALEDGIVFTVPVANGPPKHVFLQARCVYAHLDTKALEKFANVKGSGSKDGCPLCNSQVGIYEPTLAKVIYPNARHLLDSLHHLRFCGQSSFNNKQDEVEYYEQKTERAKAARKVKSREVHLDNHVLDSRQERAILAGIKPPRYQRQSHPPEIRVWENDKFPLSMYQEDMRWTYTALHVDKITHARRTDENYKRNGAIAGQNRLDRANGRRQKKDCSSEGVHGVCPLCSGLKSFRYTNFCFDFMHLVANVGKYRIDITKGDRGLGDKSRRQSVGAEKHPILKYKKLDPSWKAGVVGQATVDGVMNSIFVPPLHKGEHNIKNPMKHTGYMKFKEHLTFLTVYSSYCLSYSGIKQSYVDFAARYADDLCRILDPCIQVCDIEKLIASVIETRAIQEGLFPESELVFIYHEIICIVNHLVDFGHVRGLMCFAGERALGTIASSVTKGGVHYLKSLYHRYISKEIALTKNLAIKSEYTDNSGLFSDFALKMVDIPEHMDLAFSDLDKLYSSASMLLQVQGIENLYGSSPFYRLYKAFEHSKMHLSKYCIFTGFCNWMEQIKEVYLESDLKSDCTQVRERYSSLVAGEIWNEMPPSADELNCVGSFYFKDFVALHEDILNCKWEVHHKVMVKGVAFQCRGEEYAKNNLLTSYSDRLQYSSWCRYSDKSLKYSWPLEKLVPEVPQVPKVPKAPAVPRSQKAPVDLRPEVAATKRSVRYVTSTASNNQDFSFQQIAKVARVEPVGVVVVEQTDRQGASTRSFVPPPASSMSEPALGTLRRKPIAPAQEIVKLVPQVVLTTKFGQLNYCLRLRMSGDPILDGLAFGNITTRRTTYEKLRWHHRITTVDTNTLAVSFVCLNDLDSTALALHALDSNKKFILKMNSKRGYNNIQDLENKNAVYSPRLRDPTDNRKTLDPVLNTLFFIELHPERLQFKYGNVKDDVDHTKQREKKDMLVNTRRKKIDKTVKK